jgi:hypothetical protein
MIFKKHNKKQPQTTEKIKSYYFERTYEDGETYNLYDYKGDVVYSAKNEGLSDNEYTFTFYEAKKNKKTTHKISRRFMKDVNGTKTLSFKIDGVDAYDMLSQFGIYIRYTSISDTVTDLHIFQDEDDFALARMTRKPDKRKVIRYNSRIENYGMLFIVFFIISKLY